MQLIEETRTLTDIKKHADLLVDELNEKKHPIIITKNGKPVFVILNLEIYDRLKNEHSLLKMVTRSETPSEAERTIR